MGNNTKIKAQVMLEFSAAFIALLILLVATTKLFVWFGSNIVNRHKAYEDSRTTTSYYFDVATGEFRLAPKTDFYDQNKHPLEIFK